MRSGAMRAAVAILLVLAAVSAQSSCIKDDEPRCKGALVDCCGESTFKDQINCQWGGGAAVPWKVCDHGTDEKLFEVERGDYDDELINAGTMEDDWATEGHEEASEFEGGLGHTDRMYMLISRTNNEFFFRSFAIPQKLQQWSPGLVVWVFARFDEPPEISYAVERGFVDENGVNQPAKARIVLNLEQTEADYMRAFGGNDSKAWVVNTFDRSSYSPRIVSHSYSFVESVTAFGRAPEIDPEADFHVWVAWLVAGEAPLNGAGNPEGSVKWEVAVEVHDPVALTIYAIGCIVLAVFTIVVAVLVKYFPKTWAKIVGFFWDRGAPPEPEDDGFDVEEDSCDEADLLEKTAEELELEEAKREQEAKEAEARRIRQQQLKDGDRDEIEHSDEEDAQDWVDEIEEQNWGPADLFKQLRTFVSAVKGMATYTGKEGMNQDSLLEHAQVLADKVKIITEIRGTKHAQVKKTPSRKTRSLAKQDVAMSPEIEAARAKTKELEDMVKARMEEKRQALNALGDQAKGKATALMSKIPFSKPAFLKGRNKEEQEEGDEEKLLQGAVLDLPFTTCADNLQEYVLPHFEKIVSLLKDLPNDSTIANVNVSQLVAQLRMAAGEVEKAILQHVPTFCSSLEKAVQQMKEDRAVLDLIDTFDEEKLEPLKQLEADVQRARETQARIIKCIKDIQRMARIKSSKYYKARGRKLLDDEDHGDDLAPTASVEDGPSPSKPVADSSAVETDSKPSQDSELARELKEAEEALTREKLAVDEQEASLASEVRQAEEESNKAERDVEEELRRKEEETQKANEADDAKASASPEELEILLKNDLDEAERAANEELRNAEQTCDAEKNDEDTALSREQDAVNTNLNDAEKEANEEKRAAEEQQQRQAAEADAAAKKEEEEAEAAVKAAEAEAAEAPPEEEKKGGLMGGLKGGLKAGLSAASSAVNEKIGDKLNKAKELAEAKKAEAAKKAAEQKRALEEKHAEKLKKMEELKAAAKEKAEAKKQELQEKHAAKLAALEEKKNAAKRLAEEKKAKAREEFEKKKQDMQKALDQAKELARRAREDREALLQEMKDKANAKKAELKAAAVAKVEAVNQRRKELQEALKDRDKLIADLKARIAAEAESLKAAVKAKADEAMMKAMSLKEKLTGGNADKAKKDLEVFIYNLKKVSLSSIRPALAGAIADVKGMVKEASANEALFVEEEPDVEEVRDDFEEGYQELNIGMLQDLLKMIVRKIKGFMGKGSNPGQIDGEDAQLVVDKMQEVRDFFTGLSEELKTKVVSSVIRLRECMDGDIPEMGNLVESLGNIKGMITRGHSLGKVVADAYKKMDGVINFEGVLGFAECLTDVKDKAALQIRQFTADDPPEVRDAAFVFKCNERQMHWEKVLNREVLLFTDKLNRVIEEGNQFNNTGEKKRKKSIWDPCMIKHSTKINGPADLVEIVQAAPGLIPSAASAYLRTVEEMCNEFKGLLEIAWKDVCSHAQKVATSAPGSEKKVAKKAFLHAGQRIETALACASYLIAMAVNGLRESGFPVYIDRTMHTFSVSRTITRELNRQMAKSLGIANARLSVVALQDKANVLRDNMASNVIQVLRKEGDDADNEAKEMEERPSGPEGAVAVDMEAQQPLQSAGTAWEEVDDEKKKKKMRKLAKYENIFTEEAFSAALEIALGYINSLGEAIRGNEQKKYSVKDLTKHINEDPVVKATIESITKRAEMASLLDSLKHKTNDLMHNGLSVRNQTLVRLPKILVDEMNEEETPEGIFLMRCKKLTDGVTGTQKEIDGIEKRSREVCTIVNATLSALKESVEHVTSHPNVDVYYVGAHHLNFVDVLCFAMHYKAEMARLSVGLDVALRFRKEKVGLPELAMWKERDQAQARQYINHLREEFMNSAIGKALMKGKEVVDAAVAKAGAFMASLDEKFGVSEKVNEKVAAVKAKAEELRASAQEQLNQLKEQAMQKINETPALKQRFDMIQQRAALFGDQKYEEEIAKLKELLQAKVEDDLVATLKDGIAAVNPVIRQAMESTQLGQGNDTGSNSRDAMLYYYTAGLYELLDTDALTLVEMETCISQWTLVVEQMGVISEFKLRDTRPQSTTSVERALNDFQQACHRGAVSIRDITAICLELLQDYWSDSQATDKRGKRRSTMADDDVALGLDQTEDPRVLYMKTRMLQRVADASHEFYRILKGACTRLQKLTLATKNVEKTFFFHNRRLRLQLQAMVGDTIFEIQQKQQKEWNTASVYTLAGSVEGAMTATKERCGSYQCTQDFEKVLDVKNVEEQEDGILQHVGAAVVGSTPMSPYVAKIMAEVQQFSMGVALVIKNQTIMALELARLKDISIGLKPQIMSFEPLPPLQKVVSGLKAVRIPGLAPNPAINPPCSWPVYFKGMIGGLQHNSKEIEGIKLQPKLGHATVPNIPIDPTALPVPPLWDKAALLAFRFSLYAGILMERLVALMVEAVKVFFNIVMMQQGLAAFEVGANLPDFDEIRASMEDYPLFVFLSDLANVFKNLFSVSSPFEGLDSWNCGGAIKALTPLFLLFGFFVVVFVLKKDWLLTLSVGILRLKIDASNARKWFVSRAGKLLGLLCLYAVQFVVVSSVGLLFGDVLQSSRSCNDFDRMMQESGFGLMWVGLWTVGLLYLSFFVFVGEPVDPPQWMWIKRESEETWEEYQGNHKYISALVFIPWSIASGCIRLCKQTLGYWDADVVDAHRIVSRADAFDDDPNDDDNRHELLLTILGKANAMFWLFFPAVGPVLAKGQEAANDPIIADVDTRINDLGLNILTPRRSRFFRWLGSMAKYTSSLTVVFTATEWAAQYTGAALVGDFIFNFFEDFLNANETITQLTSPPK